MSGTLFHTVATIFSSSDTIVGTLSDDTITSENNKFQLAAIIAGEGAGLGRAGAAAAVGAGAGALTTGIQALRHDIDTGKSATTIVADQLTILGDIAIIVGGFVGELPGGNVAAETFGAFGDSVGLIGLGIKNYDDLVNGVPIAYNELVEEIDEKSNKFEEQAYDEFHNISNTAGSAWDFTRSIFDISEKSLSSSADDLANSNFGADAASSANSLSALESSLPALLSSTGASAPDITGTIKDNAINIADDNKMENIITGTASYDANSNINTVSLYAGDGTRESNLVVEISGGHVSSLQDHLSGSSTKITYNDDGSSTSINYSGVDGAGNATSADLENADGTSQLIAFSPDGSSFSTTYSGSNGTGLPIFQDQENADGTSSLTTYNPGGSYITTGYSGPNGTGNIESVENFDATGNPSGSTIYTDGNSPSDLTGKSGEIISTGGPTRLVEIKLSYPDTPQHPLYIGVSYESYQFDGVTNYIYGLATPGGFIAIPQLTTGYTGYFNDISNARPTNGQLFQILDQPETYVFSPGDVTFIVGTNGEDKLVGTSGADIFDGEGNNDVEIGNGGNDEFRYSHGYGHLTVDENYSGSSDQSIVQFGNDVSYSDLSFSTDNTGDVLIADGVAGDAILIKDMADSPSAGVSGISVHGAPSSLTRGAIIQLAQDSTAINAIYQNALGRPAGPAGVAAWQPVLAQPGQSLATVQAAIAASPEAASDINATYQAVLGRGADAGGLAALQAVLAQPGGSLAVVRSGLAGSAEAAGNINATYQAVLGRSADAGGLATWQSALAQQGGSLAAVRSSLAGSAEAASDVNATYQAVLGRAADAGGLAAWRATLAQAGGSLAAVRTGLAGSAEAAGAINATYQSVLSRNADAGGEVVWQAILAQPGGSLAVVRSGLAGSAEAAGGINATYQAVLGRPADAGGLAAWQGSLSQPSGSVAAVRSSLAGSAEAASDVNAVYQAVLGRPADAGGLAAWQGSLSQPSGSLAAVRSGLAGSAEAASDVNSAYQSVLGRPADAGGLAGWQATLSQPNGSLAAVRIGLANSTESQARVTSLLQSDVGHTPAASEVSAAELQLASGLSLIDLNAQTLRISSTVNMFTGSPDSIQATSNVDIFALSPKSSGMTSIYGFDPGNDIIKVSHALFPNLAAIKSNEVSVPSGVEVPLDGSNHYVLLQGVTASNLVPADFRFV